MKRACPDCEQGKHRNCTGYAWDINTDQETTCPCADNQHEWSDDEPT